MSRFLESGDVGGENFLPRNFAAILFVVTSALMLLIRRLWPMAEPYRQRIDNKVGLTPWKSRHPYAILLLAANGTSGGMWCLMWRCLWLQGESNGDDQLINYWFIHRFGDMLAVAGGSRAGI